MAATSVHRGTVVRNDSSGVWAHVWHANGDVMGDFGPALVVPGTIVTVGAPVIVSFEQNVRFFLVILGNYGPTYVPGGTLLQSVAYEPGTTATYNLASSIAAIDGTNLTIAFEVPSSGRVIAAANIWGRCIPPLNEDVGTYILLGYVTHGTSVLVGTVQRFCEGQGITTDHASVLSGPVSGGMCGYSALVTELTPGAQVQWDLAGYYGGSPSQAIVGAGNNTAVGTPGQALLSIYAA